MIFTTNEIELQNLITSIDLIWYKRIVTLCKKEQHHGGTADKRSQRIFITQRRPPCPEERVWSRVCEFRHRWPQPWPPKKENDQTMDCCNKVKRRRKNNSRKRKCYWMEFLFQMEILLRISEAIKRNCEISD